MADDRIGKGQASREVDASWEDLMDPAHVRAFTVAAGNPDGMLAAFQALRAASARANTMIGRALAEGISFRQFQGEIASHGR